MRIVGDIDVIDRELTQIDAKVDALLTELAWLRSERQVFSGVLREFYESSLSLSSVQPILDLAVALNPDLKATP